MTAANAIVTKRPVRTAAGFLPVVIFCAAHAQELEPLAYAHNPTGANFLVAGYGYTWGDILFDTSSPLSDVSARSDSMLLGYGRTFSMLGRSANFAVAAPIVWGAISGKLEGEPGQVSRSGLADPRIRVGLNLFGGPALAPAAFATAAPKTTLGATVVVAPPLGEYMPDKLINLGANRWSVKTELGLSHPRGKWRFEVAAGAWWFGDNNEFLGDSVRRQDPILTWQLHAVYTIRRQFWVAASGTWYKGGTTSVDGIDDINFQSNTRVGITGSYPITRRQSIKLSYNSGVTTRVGGDFEQLVAVWQFTWF